MRGKPFSHARVDGVLLRDQVPNTILALNFASHALRLIMRRSGGPEAMARWLGVEAIPSHQVEAEQTEELVQLRLAGNLGGPGQ